MWNAVESSCSISSVKLYAMGQLKFSEFKETSEMGSSSLEKINPWHSHHLVYCCTLADITNWSTTLFLNLPLPASIDKQSTSILQMSQSVYVYISTACWLLEVWSMTCLKRADKRGRVGIGFFGAALCLLSIDAFVCVYSLGVPSCSNFAPTFHIDLFFCCRVSLSFPSPPYPFLLVLLFHSWRVPPIHLQNFQFSRSVWR